MNPLLFFPGGLGGTTSGGLFNQQQTQTGLGGVGATGGMFGGQPKVLGGLFGSGTSTQQGGLGTGGLFGGQTTQAGAGLFGGGQRPGGLFSGNPSTGLSLGGSQVQRHRQCVSLPLPYCLSPAAWRRALQQAEWSGDWGIGNHWPWNWTRSGGWFGGTADVTGHRTWRGSGAPEQTASNRGPRDRPG